jgi:hypothetical protein
MGFELFEFLFGGYVLEFALDFGLYPVFLICFFIPGASRIF